MKFVKIGDVNTDILLNFDTFYGPITVNVARFLVILRSFLVILRSIWLFLAVFWSFYGQFGCFMAVLWPFDRLLASIWPFDRLLASIWPVLTNNGQYWASIDQ